MKVTSLFQEIEEKFIDAVSNLLSFNEKDYNSDFKRNQKIFMQQLNDLQSEYPLLTHYDLSFFRSDPQKMLEKIEQNQSETNACLPSGLFGVFDFGKFQIHQPALLDMSEKKHIYIPYCESTIDYLPEFILNALLSKPLGKAHVFITSFDRDVSTCHMIPEEFFTKITNLAECYTVGNNCIIMNEESLQSNDDSSQETNYIVMLGHPYSFSSKAILETYSRILKSQNMTGVHIILVDIYENESFSSIFPIDNCHIIEKGGNIFDIPAARIINDDVLSPTCFSYLRQCDQIKKTIKQDQQNTIEFLNKECTELNKLNKIQSLQIQQLKSEVHLLHENKATNEKIISDLERELSSKDNEINSLKNDISNKKSEISSLNWELASHVAKKQEEKKKSEEEKQKTILDLTGFEFIGNYPTYKLDIAWCTFLVQHFQGGEIVNDEEELSYRRWEYAYSEYEVYMKNSGATTIYRVKDTETGSVYQLARGNFQSIVSRRLYCPKTLSSDEYLFHLKSFVKSDNKYEVFNSKFINKDGDEIRMNV